MEYEQEDITYCILKKLELSKFIEKGKNYV